MAYLALYRKYRPSNFDEVVGQDDVVRILKNQILSDRIGHAYLFTGIRGTGKTSIAKIFARAVNCQSNSDGNPCNHCEVCENIDQPSVMDIIEIDAASNRGVDEIRDIREKVIYPPKIGRYKVYIIDEVHMLTKEAFNALLKTLEEPPSHIIFILATTEVNKLPATILSRCQRFDIRPISQEKIAEQIRHILEDNHVAMDEEAIQLIAARGDHSMRDALSILDQAIDIRNGDEIIAGEAVMQFLGMTSKSALFELTEAVLKNDAAGVVRFLNDLKRKGNDSLILTGQLIDMFRQLMIVKTVGNAAQSILELSRSEVKRLKEMGQHTASNRLFRIIDDLIEDRQKMRYHDCPDIILEMCLLKQCEGSEVSRDQSVSVDMNSAEERFQPPEKKTEFTGRSAAGEKQTAAKISITAGKATHTAEGADSLPNITSQRKTSSGFNEKATASDEIQVKKENTKVSVEEKKDHNAKSDENMPLRMREETAQSIAAPEENASLNIKAASAVNLESANEEEKVVSKTDTGQVTMLRQEIENWNQRQDFFTAQIVSYGNLKYVSPGQYMMVYHAPDHNMYAEMFKGRVQNQVEALISNILGMQIHLETACSTKKYDEMDIVEKTTAIVGEAYQSKIQVND